MQLLLEDVSKWYDEGIYTYNSWMSKENLLDIVSLKYRTSLDLEYIDLLSFREIDEIRNEIYDKLAEYLYVRNFDSFEELMEIRFRDELIIVSTFDIRYVIDEIITMNGKLLEVYLAKRGASEL